MTIPESLTLERDIIFNQNPDRPLRLHLLRRKQASSQSMGQPVPAIVFVHGGAFRMGSREDGEPNVLVTKSYSFSPRATAPTFAAF